MSTDTGDDTPGIGLSDAGRAAADLVADVLERRASASGAAAREVIAERFRAAARGDDEPDPSVVDALAAFRSLAPTVWAGRTSLPDEEIALMARTLDRVAARRRHRREAAGGRRTVLAGSAGISDPASDWAREVRALLEDSPTPTPTLLGELGAGVEMEDAARWSLDAGPEHARLLIERAGECWDGGSGARGGSYANIYRAARRAGGWDDAPSPTPERASGVVSTSTALAPVVSDVRFTDAVRSVRRVRGRQTLVQSLVGAIRDGGDVREVLVGHAGMGKTTVAAEVARQVSELGLPTFWITAQDDSALVAGLEQVALARDVPLSEVQAAHRRATTTRAYVERLWTLMESQRRASGSLLVLDDTTSEIVADCLHHVRAGVAMIVTTRSGTPGEWAPGRLRSMRELHRFHAEQVVLDRFELARDEAGRHSTGPTARGEEMARRICALLPGLPLALTSVGDLLARGGLPDLDRIDRVTARTAGDTVRAVYEVCLDALGADRALGRVLLRLLACFAPDELVPGRIVERLGALDAVIAAWRSELPVDVVRGLRGGDAVQGIAALVRVGLVERAGPAWERAVRVHPALAEQSRRDFGDGPATVFLDTLALQMLEAERAQLDAGRPADWPAVLAIEPHVHELVESPALGPARVGDDLGARVLALADRTSTALTRSGRHEAATALLDGALASYGWLGGEHPAVLAAQLTRAWMTALDRGGDLPQARRRLEALASICTRVLGPDAEVTISVLDTLGWVLAELDELGEARELLDVVVRRRRGSGAGGARAALAARHRLAWVRVMLGEGHAGVEEFREVLADRIQALGSEDHLDVLSTMYRLAWALSRLRRHEDAREQFQALLERSERLLGADHPLTLMVRSRVAWSAMWAGDLRVAKKLYTDLIPTQEKVLGEAHRRVLVNAHNLAVLGMRLGNPVAAEEELRRIVVAKEELLGSDHALSMDSREMHAWALFRCGRAEEADRELVALLADRRRVLGEAHPATVDARYLTARVVLHRGRLADAQERLEELLADAAAHAVTVDRRILLRARHSLAVARGLQGAQREASRELRSVLRSQTMEFGSDDEDVLSTRDRLVWVDAVMGRRESLVVAARAVRDDRVRVLGADHPHTATSRYRLAWSLLLVGLLPSASREYDDLVHDLEGLRGRSHPHTVRARIGRLQLWRMTGRVSELLPEADDVVRAATEVQGPLAVATLRAEEERAQVAVVRGELSDAAQRFREVRDRQSRVLGSNHLDVRRLYRLEGGVRGGPVPTPDSYPVR
ncbi:tetratricopeptide repeat protein [Actinomycetospora sp. TBRC 11914]|uniref:tetratricopeptide repeat protein n=1 Tax=Actinomycetospora sp. TBRC 11914 TaxID=2729387 RepID=UPI00145F6290|nr:tetratricopeptide repeat protein [Actinomycetospora sp. TBRC 11914]NMO91125.1 tetratricopeptide repeat protein [Actinomycetospora sp. TBRC 11914]